MSARITHARIDSIATKLDFILSKIERVQADIDKMRLGDTRAADSERVAALRTAHSAIGAAKDIVETARPR